MRYKTSQLPQSPCQILACPFTSRCTTERLACHKFHAWVTVSNQIPKRRHWENKSGEPTRRYYELLFSN